MKTPTRVLDVESNLEGEKVKLTIDVDAMSHIMSVLTDLYSDPELAVIREYSTNALDAHVEAGVSLPIQVTLPSTLSPYLKIRDFGDGLDAEDIRNVYSRYGASTKRDTNEQVGSLGLGCKSALTYTDQFTVQGIKDGICTQIVVSRDEDGAGSMTLVDQYETDETSGVEITVPVKAYNSFAEQAAELFKFWPEGTVEVNGEQPERFKGIKLADDIFVSEEKNESKIVMGGVAYPFTADDDYHFSTVVFVDIGDVQFTPSREALQMTAKTKAVLADIGLRVTNLKESAVQAMVDEATSKPEALRLALKASALFQYKGDLTYKGKAIPSGFTTKGVQENEFLIYRPWKRGYGARMVGETSTIASSFFPKSLFMTGFSTKTLSQTQKRKIQKYCENLGIGYGDYDQVVLLTSLPFSSWVEKIQIIDWDTVNAIKLDKVLNDNGRPKGAYDMLRVDNTRSTEVVEAADIDMTVGLYWFPHEKNGYIGYQVRQEIEALQALDPTARFVQLKANRIDKFERDFAHAENVFKAVKRIAQDWFDALTDDEREFLAVQKLSDEWGLLDGNSLDDPKLQMIVTRSAEKNDELLRTAQRYQYRYEGEIPEIDMGEYPLLDMSDMRYGSDEKIALVKKHIVLYLNAVYASREAGEKEKN